MAPDNRDGSSKRRSFFARSSLSTLSIGSRKDDDEPSNLLRKKRTSSLITNLSTTSPRDDSPLATPGSASPELRGRPTMSQRSSGSKRPSSVFGSFRGLKLSDEDNEEPLSAVSTRPRSANWRTSTEDSLRNRLVLHHGEVQTSSSVFRKKREYLVLTEAHLTRFKSQQKASEAFNAVPSPNVRTSARHSQTPSGASSHEWQSLASDASGDRELGVPLRQIVAVYQLDDGKPYFAIEVSYLDDETNNASGMTLQFGDPDDMRLWVARIREAANRARLADENPLSADNSHVAARVVEKQLDYVPPHYAVYKVVQRPHGKGAPRSSSDDLTKVSASVMMLAIGVHKVHLITLPKAPLRQTSSPSLNSLTTHNSYGILTLTELHVSETDDNFELTFRTPLEAPKILHLASLASHDIAVRLRYVEENLRPEWETRPYLFKVPDDVKHDILRQASPHMVDHDSLDRTLIGYCVSYGVQPGNISYRISCEEDDALCFELLPRAGTARHYTVLELLAVMRALRYNETFKSISFSGIHLDALNGVCDEYGSEHVCTKTKRGTQARLDASKLGRSCLLVQEIQALALTSRKLRRMDFSSCITRRVSNYTDTSNRARDIGCGIVEALFPLCKYQTTNVDWVALNNIQISNTDLEFLIAAATEKSCHFRALELSGCGLDDRALTLILDSLRSQENTLEALDISANPCRLVSPVFDSQIGAFGFLTKVNLSHTQISGSDPLINYETFKHWRLKELVLSGTSLNAASVDAIASYLANFNMSKGLRVLNLDHCYLSAPDVAVLLKSMTKAPGEARQLQFDVSENYLERDIYKLNKAIGGGFAPAQLTIRLLEFEIEADFRRLIEAFTANNTIQKLDISRVSLPSDASEETCHALETLFAENKTLEWLDISGEDSRLEISKLGVGINKALRGLEHNHTMRVLFIKHQKLGLQGASTLADVLKVNDALEQLHCDNNGISLPGFTDLVNALYRNTTLLYLPSMQESRQMALKQTEDQIKQMRNDSAYYPQSKGSSVRSKLATAVGGKSSNKDKGPTVQHLSDQDIKAALALVDESWQRQIFRLEQYLQRNNNIAHGIPVVMDVDDEEFERPGTAASLTQIVEKVQFETTPTFEKQVQLGDSAHEDEESDSLGKGLEMALSEKRGY